VISPEQNSYDAVVLAVAHDQFKELGAAGIRAFGKPEHVLYDLKYILPASEADLRL
jgi:UDP-N-acetyl-D-galactosamine dehydrogenase